MRPSRIPTTVFVLCALAFVLLVWQTVGLLPERVATHFAGDGTPNGWMTREGYARFVMLFGLGMGLFPVLIGQLMGALPAWTFNMPNRTYWLAPQRRTESVAWLRTHMLWLGCIMLGFIAAVHWLTVVANMAPGARLETGSMIPLMVVFVGACIVWSVVLLLKFRRPKGAQAWQT